ncbi:P-loop NTPase fold protein [uncultured Porphyromonas sp.]|uniref:KAP family P-loop NTPase fold protein n=1 Tax=uncultured Porphyromonas sp. TaxID=159274 RepID=UPI00261F1730|nr:P-loop NTPase fold protein [uncultured Porphyromonas sp.]
MSPNEETQNQATDSQATSQEATPEPKVPSLQEVHEAPPEPQASPVKTTCKASPSLLRKCWSELRAFLCLVRALLSIISWEATNILEYLFGVLAESRVPIVLWVLFVFLHKPIEEFAVERLVAPVLAHFDTGIIPSSTMLVLALCFAVYAFLLCSRRYVVRGKWVLTALMVLLGYYYYRCTPQDLEAIAPFRFALLFDGAWPPYLASRVATLQPQRWAFADIIPFTCILLLLVWGYRYVFLGIKQLAQIRRCSWTAIRGTITSWVEKFKKRYAPFVREQTRKQAHKVKGFLTDHPLTEEEEELSGWTSQAQTLTQKLLATDTTRAAFSLGIVASWGEGKSSFMGIMQRYLQQAQREVIVMRFNPWLYDKEAQLTKVFFEELRRTLAPYSSKLSKSIDNYADLLLAVDSGWLKLTHQPLRQPQRNTAEQFDKLSRNIQELGRKVVIFIDDVDRLTREELMELFNLVRNSSNLPCLYFVLAYDKSYVLKTLQSDGEHMSRYPEKIFQEEYPLPKLTPDKMWAALKRCLNETQLGKGNYMLVQQLLDELKGKGVNLPYHLATIRMVKRMVNAFNSRYELLHEVGVAPFDLFIFELIYYVHPKVYDLLTEMHKKAIARLDASPEKRRPYSTYSLCPIFFSHTNTKGMQYISLHPEGEASSDPYSEASWNPYPVVDALKKLDFGLKDGYKEDIVVENIVELLELLWGKDRKPALGQINHMAYWRRYFYRGLQVGELSQEEFASFLANIDRSERKQCLERWSQEKPIAFMQEVLGYPIQQQMQREGLIYNKMETIVYAMFDWNTLASKDMAFDRTEIDALIRRVNLSDNLKRALLLEVLRDKQIRKAAFDYTRAWLWGRGHELFTLKTPAPREAAKDKSTLLSREDLVRVQVYMFRKEALRNTSIPDLYMLWWLRCGLRENRDIKRARKIDQLMRKRIEKDIEGFLEAALHQTDHNTYELLDIPWKSLTKFNKYLSRHTDKPYVENFREFLSIALKREQELKQEAPVVIKIEPGQWERMRRPNFGSIRIYALDEDHPFFFTPPEENQA